MRQVNGIAEIPDPELSFETHIARALKRKHVEKSDEFLMRLAQVAQYDPDVLDEFDLNVHMREMARIHGWKSPVIRSEQEVMEITKAKMEAQAQQEQAAMAMQGAEALGKLPDQAVNQLLPQA